MASHDLEIFEPNKGYGPKLGSQRLESWGLPSKWGSRDEGQQVMFPCLGAASRPKDSGTPARGDAAAGRGAAF